MIRILVVALFLVGCDVKEPESTQKSSNPQFSVSMLFKHDGCVVNRFLDNNNYHYYVVCENGSKSTITSHSESCGKGCTRHYDEDISTI